MLKKLKHKIFILILISIIFIPIVVNARYFEKIENIRGKAIIAEPIFKVENLQPTVITDINKESGKKEYIFNIQNYVLEENNITKRISQVDMNYNIEIINEKSNFPIKYELYESGNNINVLNENGKTSNILIKKDIEYFKTYILVVYWEDKQGILENSNNIKIIVNSSQVK